MRIGDWSSDVCSSDLSRMSSLAIRACRSRHCSADVLLRRSNPASLAFFVFPGRVDPAPSKKFPAGLVGSTDQLVFYVQPPTIVGQSCFFRTYVASTLSA